MFSNTLNNARGLRLHLFLSLFFVIAFEPYLGHAQTATRQVAAATPSGTKYWIYTPELVLPKYPVLIVLHGGSSIGDNLSFLTSNSDQFMPARLISVNNWRTDLPFIVVSPQLKDIDNNPNNNNFQVWPLETIDELINHLVTFSNVDPNRIYLSGISLGAAGAWAYSTEHPEKLAALIPISGKTDLAISNACNLTQIPVWALHGEADNLVKPIWSKNMVNAINSCPTGRYKAELTLLVNQGHEGWNDVYNGSSGYDIYSWMLKFSKTNLSNALPYVNAGTDKKILMRNEPFDITGHFFDSDGTITTALWTQTGGTSLPLSGTNNKTLKIEALQPGIFEFQLTVTDNYGGVSTDKVKIEVVNTASSNYVSSIIVTNGNEVDIGNLSQEGIVSPPANEMNLRAVVSNDVSYVRFRINEHQNARPSAYGNFPLWLTSSVTSWKPEKGDYNICATPFKSNGEEGITVCYNVNIISEPATNGFYYLTGSNVTSLASWNSKKDQTGLVPSSFSNPNQSFIIDNNAVISESLSIGGSGSSLTVRNNGQLTINNNYNGIINAEGNAHIIINTNSPITFGKVGPNTTIIFGAIASTIAPLPVTNPKTEYGNVILRGTLDGNVANKSLPTGETYITGNLTIEEGVLLNRAETTPTSKLFLRGNLIINSEATPFVPTRVFSMEFNSAASQSIFLNTPKASFNHLLVSAGTVVKTKGQLAGSTLELGSNINGSGLELRNNGHLYMNENHLSIIGVGTISISNSSVGNEGKLGFRNGDLSIISTRANRNSGIFTITGADSIRNLTVNIAHTLNILNNVYITEAVQNDAGAISSGGNLILVSTPTKTARIGKLGASANITGNVQFQRTVEPGRKYRYLSFPVTGTTVADLQNYIPVTGGFPQTSTGPGLSTNPSMHEYDAANGKWEPYPKQNANQPLTLGKGYSVFVRNSTDYSKVILSGPIHKGTFNYTVFPDPDPSLTGTNNGWNLLGNPYAAPIKWGGPGWTSNGINATVYVRDNDAPNGRFLQWDGNLGDPEFKGVIAQGQSFWVRATVASGQSLSINEDAKVNQSNAVLYRTNETEQFGILNVEVRNNDVIDRTFLSVSEEKQDNFEPAFDAVKQKNDFLNLSTLSTDSVALAINYLSNNFCAKSVVLALDEVKPGSMSLIFDGSIFDDALITDISLVDKFADEVVELKKGSTYNFDVTADSSSLGKKRFELQFQIDELRPEIAVEGVTLKSNYENGNQWLFNGQPIEGATSSSFTPTETGEYQLLITRGECSKTSEAFSFRITDINSPSTGEVSVSPNPAQGYIFVNGIPNHLATDYALINPQGMEMQRGVVSAEHNGEIKFSNPRMAKGLYILKLRNERWGKVIKLIIE